MTYDEHAADLDAFELADLARRTYLEAGEGEAGIQAAVSRLETHPAAAAVAVEGEVPGAAIHLTDQTGFTVSLWTGAPEPVPEAEREASAAELAELWGEHLAAGGGLVVASSGAVLLIPAGEIEEVLGATEAAFAGSEAERQAALLALYEDETIVADLLAHYEPGAAGSLGATAAPFTALKAAARPARLSPAAVTGPVGCCKTPGNRTAVVFVRGYSNQDFCYKDFGIAMLHEGYLVSFLNPDITWEAFLSASGAGAACFNRPITAYPNGILLEQFQSKTEAESARARYQGPSDAGDLHFGQAYTGSWYMAVTENGIRSHWRSNDSIVIANFSSPSLAGAFGAREFFSSALYPLDVGLLMRRLTGKEGEASLRQASEAFGAGLYGWLEHQDGSPDGDTVLSPAVVSAGPVEPLPVGSDRLLGISFDAQMNTGIPPEEVIKIEGCAEPQADPSWAFESGLSMPVVATAPGVAIVTVDANAARSTGGIALDGNQNPEGTSGVAPNHDNYVFWFQCVAAPEEPPPVTDPEPEPVPEEPVPEDPVPEPTPSVTLGEPTVCVTHGDTQSLIEWLWGMSFSGEIDPTQVAITLQITDPYGSTDTVTTTVGELFTALFLFDIFVYGDYPFEITSVVDQTTGQALEFSGTTSGTVSVGFEEQNPGACSQ